MAKWAIDKQRAREAQAIKEEQEPHCDWKFCKETDKWETSCGYAMSDVFASLGWAKCPFCHLQITKK